MYIIIVTHAFALRIGMHVHTFACNGMHSHVFTMHLHAFACMIACTHMKDMLLVRKVAPLQKLVHTYIGIHTHTYTSNLYSLRARPTTTT